MFFCLLNFAYEIPSFRRLEKLRSRSKHAVCMFVEVWSSHAEQYRRSIELLNEMEFDHVFVNLSSCLPAVRSVLRRPCSFLPLAVDALRFAPWPHPPSRVIDYYSMGRRSEVTHKALLRLAEEKNRFYFFDSAVRSAWNDFFDHRRLLASLLQRTRFLLAHTLLTHGPGYRRGRCTDGPPLRRCGGRRRHDWARLPPARILTSISTGRMR